MSSERDEIGVAEPAEVAEAGEMVGIVETVGIGWRSC
jgi:hypothetical protein